MMTINNVFAFLLVIFICIAQNHQPANQSKEFLADNLISFEVNEGLCNI